MSHDPEQVLSFWFGDLDALGRADAEHSARFWKKDAAFDAEIRERFMATHAAATLGELGGWLGSPRGRLAYIVVTDQLSRNMFPGTPAMFASDGLALGAAVDGIALGHDRASRFEERSFFYMPLMHSEDLAAQDECVALFAAFRDEFDGPRRERAEGSLAFAKRHRDIVTRFGRFPHRNAILGRSSTAEEIEFLKGPGSAF